MRRGKGYCVDLELPSYLTQRASRLGETLPPIFVAVIAGGRTLHDCGAVVCQITDYWPTSHGTVTDQCRSREEIPPLTIYTCLR